MKIGCWEVPKPSYPPLTLTSWVKCTSPFLFWAWSQNFRSTGLHFQLTTKSTMMIGRAALLTGYHPHILGLQRAGVGRLVLWSIYLSSDLENTFYRFHPYGLNTNVKWVSKLSHPSEIACSPLCSQRHNRPKGWVLLLPKQKQKWEQKSLITRL